MEFFPFFHFSLHPERTLTAAAALLCTLALAGCGGGGGGSSSVTTLSGMVAKGPVGGSTITVRNAATGAALATATTATDGSFSLPLSFAGDAIVEANGGSYADEASGSAATLSTPLRTVVPVQGATATAVLTPLTTWAYTYAFGSSTSGVSSSAFVTTATALASQLQLGGVNLASTMPVVSGTPNSYGQALRAVSQYLKNTGTSLAALTTTRFTALQWQAFSNTYTDAYDTINGASTAFVFTGAGLAATAAGSCGVNVSGTVVARGFTLPLNRDFCVGLAQAGDCSAAATQTTLRALVANQGGVLTTPGLAYVYTPQCVAGATGI